MYLTHNIGSASALPTINPTDSIPITLFHSSTAITLNTLKRCTCHHSSQLPCVMLSLPTIQLVAPSHLLQFILVSFHTFFVRFVTPHTLPPSPSFVSHIPDGAVWRNVTPFLVLTHHKRLPDKKFSFLELIAPKGRNLQISFCCLVIFVKKHAE